MKRSEKYHWFGDFYLYALQDKKGIYLKITYENVVKKEKEIRCIHTAISKVTPEGTIVESSEGRRIHLSREEEWFAFKSWVEGIAEAGEDAIYIQAEVELATRGYSLLNPMINFIAMNDKGFLDDFILHLERNYEKEGTAAENYVKANLLSLKDYGIYNNELADLLVSSSLPTSVIKETLGSYLHGFSWNNYSYEEKKRAILIKPSILAYVDNDVLKSFSKSELDEIKEHYRWLLRKANFDVQTSAGYGIATGVSSILAMESVVGVHVYEWLALPFLVIAAAVKPYLKARKIKKLMKELKIK